MQLNLHVRFAFSRVAPGRRGSITIDDCELPGAFAAGRHSPTLLTMQAKDPPAFAVTAPEINTQLLTAAQGDPVILNRPEFATFND
jgi:hypothetical protein